MIKIATFNINSIRARLPNFIDWMKCDKPDVILLQELKCLEEQFPFFELEDHGYNIEIIGQKSHNGVGILSKFPLYNVSKKLPLYNLLENDDEARYIEANFDYNGKTIKIASLYVPNGGPSVIDMKNNIKDITTTENFNKKMIFYDRLKIKFQENIKNNELSIFGGDYNVCPVLSIDVYSEQKDGAITCNIKERNKFKEFIDINMSDIWREYNKNLKEYSWWGYRPTYMFERNLGYRLDAFLTTPKINKFIKNVYINKKPRSEEKPSDHVPMICEIEL